jgi:hypothetical protein
VVPPLVEDGRPYEGGAQTPGTIVSVEQRLVRDGDGHESRVCTGLVRYEVEGRTHQVETTYSSGGLCDDVGRVLEVSYLPAAPEQGRPQAEHQARLLDLAVVPGYLVGGGAALALLRRLGQALVGAGTVLSGRRLTAARRPEPDDALRAQLREAWREPGEVEEPSAVEQLRAALVDVGEQRDAAEAEQRARGRATGWLPGPPRPRRRRAGTPTRTGRRRCGGGTARSGPRTRGTGRPPTDPPGSPAGRSGARARSARRC